MTKSNEYLTEKAMTDSSIPIARWEKDRWHTTHQTYQSYLSVGSPSEQEWESCPLSFAQNDCLEGVSMVFMRNMRNNNCERIRQDLIRRFYLPPAFWRESFERLSGGYGSAVLTDDAGAINGLDLWFNYYIKHVVPKNISPHLPYHWDELTIFSHWRADHHLTMFFFDIPPNLEHRFLTACRVTSVQQALRDPFTVIAQLNNVVCDLHDDSVWAIRDVIRLHEKARMNITPNVDFDFPSLHEVARHAIHSCETLETAEANVSSMASMHRRLFLEPHGKAITVSSTDEMIRQQKSILAALKQRSDSNLKRITNEIGLAFNSVAQRDSHATLMLTRAATSDSRAMRQIAVLTTVFLPGTFVASLFSTVFFTGSSVSDDANSTLHASGTFWIYWAVTIPLSIFVGIALWGLHTFGTWRFLRRQKMPNPTIQQKQ